MIPRATEELKRHCRALGAQIPGRAFRAYLETVVRDCVPLGRDDGALREHNAIRNFARELISLFEDREVDGTRSEQPAEQPAGGTDSAGSTGQPAGRAHGAQRRVISAQPARSG